MTCYRPLKGWIGKEVNESGKRSIVFRAEDALCSAPILLPCGQCIGCRLDHSKEWALRCINEASLYERNCFVTLTFDSDKLFPYGDVVLDKRPKKCYLRAFNLFKCDFVKFMKRLRRKYGEGIRFFHCGEYGSNFNRPHHHACLFNFDFPDKVLWSVRNGVSLYRSEELEKIWPFGFSVIGDVTFESAAYVARYVMKKITGEKAIDHYQAKEQEYCSMSRRPGLGKNWLMRFKDDVYPDDFIVMKGGFKYRPPRYYDNIYDLTDHEKCDSIKSARVKKNFNNKDNSPARLEEREKVHILKAKKLERTLECC